MDTGVTQVPTHLIMGTSSKKLLKCEQHLGHNAMDWHKHSAQEPPKLMCAYNYRKITDNVTVPSRFTPERPNSSRLHLHVDALRPEDSAVYLCASRRDTALRSHPVPVQKAQGCSQEAVGQPRLTGFPGGAQPETRGGTRPGAHRVWRC